MTDKIDAISRKIENNNSENNFERIKNDAETYENKIKFFQKIYIIVIGLSILFFFIFLYPYFTIHYNLNLISQIETLIHEIDNEIPPLIKEFFHTSVNLEKGLASITNNKTDTNKLDLDNMNQILNNKSEDINKEIESFKIRINGLTNDNLLESNIRFVLIDLNSNLTKLNNQVKNKTDALNQDINLLSNNYSKYKNYSFSESSDRSYNLSNFSKQLESVIQEQNKTLIPIGQNLVDSFKQIEFPLFKISLNLEQIITIFPIAVIIGFMISAFQVVEIIHFKSYIENTYTGDAKSYIEKRSPSWINIDSRLHRSTFFALPSFFFVVGVLINILFFISDYKINDIKISSNFLQSNIIYAIPIFFFYIIGIILIFYSSIMLNRACIDNLNDNDNPLRDKPVKRSKDFKRSSYFKISWPLPSSKFGGDSDKILFSLFCGCNIAVLVILVPIYFIYYDLIPLKKLYIIITIIIGIPIIGFIIITIKRRS